MRIYLMSVMAVAALADPAAGQDRGRNGGSNPPTNSPTGVPSTGWVVDGKTGCKSWDPGADPDEHMTWSGDCTEGMAEGKGVLQFYIGATAGTRYEGEMRNGRADGRGVNLQPDGARYEGEWRNNAANGPGIYTKGSERFEGIWTAGCLKQGAVELAVGVSRESCGFK
jgi:hypothetical protein